MPRRRTRNVNLMQLAEHTGLSVAAVSSVLNGLSKERRISEESVKKVREAARELGYVPNIFARRLSSHAPGTSQALLAVVTAFEAPLTLVSRAAMALHRAVEAADLRHTRFTLTIEMFDAGELRKLPGILDHHRFSGAIIANTIEADDRFLAQATIPYPVVTINRALPNCAAVLESSDTGRAAADLLLKAGCKRCAVLAPAAGTTTTASRMGVFHAAVETATGRAPIDIVAGGRAEEDGYHAMRAHLQRHRDTDGLYAINDTLAIGAYHAIHESGRRIPQDVKVVGVGDHTASPHLTPPLTCVGASEEELHQEAAALLLALFTGRETGAPHRIMPLQIVRRPSTG
jgi:LacI family transcriptional regulator